MAVIRGSLPDREPPLPRLLQGLAALLRNFAAEARVVDAAEASGDRFVAMQGLFAYGYSSTLRTRFADGEAPSAARWRSQSRTRRHTG